MKQAGFTLIELLVGLFLFGLMAAAGTALLAGGVQAGTQAQAIVGHSGDLARMGALLTADAGQSAARLWRDRDGKAHPAFSANDGALFTLVRRGWANPAAAPRASVQRVSWAVEGDALVRRAAPMVDGTDAGMPSVVLKGVTSVRLRILGSAGWQDGWLSRDPTAVPRALELTVAGPQIGQLRQIVVMGPA
ncbi:MAG: type II secretion system minor pseudopilin GspJ [Sphingomonadales bacterium]|jgi:general secretion pathway protein J